MKAFDTSSKRFLGSGCSREAWEMKNGTVCKKSTCYSELWAGSPDREIFRNLINQYSDLKQIKKFQKLVDEGYKVDGGAYGILTEFLVSKLAMEEGFEDVLALCLDVRIRRNNKKNQIDVVGLYENALTTTKHKTLSKRDDMVLFNRDLEIDGLDFIIKDIHYHNLINDLIVDYACVSEWD